MLFLRDYKINTGNKGLNSKSKIEKEITHTDFQGYFQEHHRFETLY